MHFTASYNSPVGTILITEADHAIVSLIFSDTNPIQNHIMTPLLQQCTDWLDAYFAGKQPDPSLLPLHLNGSVFQKRVWKILRNIPYGQSISYGQIAKQIDAKMSAQAVGRAVGSNPASILVPCHRVLGAGGRLTGYAFGLDIKRKLLDLESIPYRD